jgi:hypothetical protein
MSFITNQTNSDNYDFIMQNKSTKISHFDVANDGHLVKVTWFKWIVRCIKNWIGKGSIDQKVFQAFCDAIREKFPNEKTVYYDKFKNIAQRCTYLNALKNSPPSSPKKVDQTAGPIINPKHTEEEKEDNDFDFAGEESSSESSSSDDDGNNGGINEETSKVVIIEEAVMETEAVVVVRTPAPKVKYVVETLKIEVEAPKVAQPAYPSEPLTLDRMEEMFQLQGVSLENNDENNVEKLIDVLVEFAKHVPTADIIINLMRNRNFKLQLARPALTNMIRLKIEAKIQENIAFFNLLHPVNQKAFEDFRKQVEESKKVEVVEEEKSVEEESEEEVLVEEERLDVSEEASLDPLELDDMENILQIQCISLDNKEKENIDKLLYILVEFVKYFPIEDVINELVRIKDYKLLPPFVLRNMIRQEIELKIDVNIEFFNKLDANQEMFKEHHRQAVERKKAAETVVEEQSEEEPVDEVPQVQEEVLVDEDWDTLKNALQPLENITTETSVDLDLLRITLSDVWKEVQKYQKPEQGIPQGLEPIILDFVDKLPPLMKRIDNVNQNEIIQIWNQIRDHLGIDIQIESDTTEAQKSDLLQAFVSHRLALILTPAQVMSEEVWDAHEKSISDQVNKVIRDEDNEGLSDFVLIGKIGEALDVKDQELLGNLYEAYLEKREEEENKIEEKRDYPGVD